MSHTISKRARTVTSAIAAGALLVAPGAALAKKGDHGTSHHANKGAAACAKAHSVGFSVLGTLVSATVDNPATPASEATVTLTVLAANHNARMSGDIADQDAVKKGVQVKGATFTVPAGDAFKLRLRDYQGADTPSPGDLVKVNGRIARTKARCAAPGTSVADLFGAIDVRKVTIHDRDPDA
ncbi:MAG TPA: hypothetical protein VL738_32335 [Dactylosporangium sp.]|nr:hypothetical protein [Dactylosporangium sp.]